MSDGNFIGKSVLRIDAVEKVTGKAMFGSDFDVPGSLCGKTLRSPHAHARIRALDVSKAARLPGVRAIVTPVDVPAITIAPFFGDQYALCRENTVRCVGEPVAAIAADSEEIAEEAIRYINVEYEILPAVFDAEEAMAVNPPAVVHPNLRDYRVLTSVPIRPDQERPNVAQTYRIRQGDAELGFKVADLIVENKFTTSRIQHCQLEPHVAVAWFEPDGSLTVKTSSQMSYPVKTALCRLFSLSPSRVRVLTGYIGGGYGGKGGVRAEPIAALLARKAGRPVRVVFTREEMFMFGGHRIPFATWIKDGVRKDGTLVAREMRVVLGMGLYSDYSILIVRRGAAGAVGTYRIPNFKYDSYGVYTNLPLTGALRGFGCPEVEWAIEQQMDIIASKLGLDPVEVRRRNILREGERDVSGMVTLCIGVEECLDKVTRWIGWGDGHAKTGGPWQTGKGIAIGNKSMLGGSTSVVTVKVWADATVEVRCSTTELGQGITTTLAQIAAQEFDTEPDKIKIVTGDTAICPYDYGTVSSRSLVHNGNALIAACADAKQQLFKMAGNKLDAFDLAIGQGRIFVRGAPKKSIPISDLFSPQGIPLKGGEVIGHGVFTGAVALEDPETGQSERSVLDYSHMATAFELAVNVETGEVKVLRNAIACDVGKALNPLIVEGQIEGGHVMGVGSALFEEVIIDRKGAVVNDRFADYHIPRSSDLLGIHDSGIMIVETQNSPDGPYGAKGVGELALVSTAPAIANAIFNAVGIRIHELPITKERVLAAIKKEAKSKLIEGLNKRRR